MIKKVALFLAGLMLVAGIVYFGSQKFAGMTADKKPASSENSAKPKQYTFQEIALQKTDISVGFEGKKLGLTLPVYVENNRYYLPLTEIVDKVGGKISLEDGTAKIEVKDLKLELKTKENSFVSNSTSNTLKKKAIVSGDVVYVSLYDLTKMLNLKTDWDENGNSIGLYWNRDKLQANKQPGNGKPALMRFEDVTAAQRYDTSESLEKLRIMFDYCYSRNIPMSLGWVPRYIDPTKNIDNDPAEKHSMHNADFVFTLDYFADRNGKIGLHGYTHQSGNQVSIDGIEFNGKYNASESSVKERLEHAIADAKKLEIPIAFFESPHYAATPAQKKVIEKYFNIIYEYKLSEKEKNITRVSVGDRTVKYIPTPLNYVNGPEDTDNMIRKIRALNSGTLGSFFYHPSIEFGFITVKKGADGYPYYEYSDQSPIHRIVNTFIEAGYQFKDINSL